MDTEDEKMTEKLFIKNRKGEKLCVVVENPTGKKLAVVMHGHGVNKNTEPIMSIADTFVEKGFLTLKFDTTNTNGESDGKLEDATMTGYYEDLEDVISWAKTQKWYNAPFFLAGYSIGGICTGLYTINNPEDIKALITVSTVVSGKLTLEAKGYSEWQNWKKQGYREYVSSVTGKIKRTPWSHYEDRLKYDLLKDADKIRIPVLMTVGDKDNPTPVSHQQLLFNALNTDKELHVIKDADHDYHGKLSELKEILKNWIVRVIK